MNLNGRDKLKLQGKYLFPISNKKMEMNTKSLKSSSTSKVGKYNFWNFWIFLFFKNVLAFVTERFQVIIITA